MTVKLRPIMSPQISTNSLCVVYRIGENDSVREIIGHRNFVGIRQQFVNSRKVLGAVHMMNCI